MSNTISRAKVKQDFIKYLMNHPEERFWQAVRNFSNYNFIIGFNGMATDIPEDMEDTFYKEEV